MATTRSYARTLSVLFCALSIPLTQSQASPTTGGPKTSQIVAVASFLASLPDHSCLSPLLRAAAQAHAAGEQARERTLCWRDLKANGLNESDVRWMWEIGLLARWEESQGGVVQTSDWAELKPSSRFALQNQISISPYDGSASQETSSVPDTPVWDPARRELYFRGELVKAYRLPAANQEKILAQFQTEGWPPRISIEWKNFIDWRPVAGSMPAARRVLNDTLRALNRSRKSTVLRFEGDGTGEGVLWTATTTSRNAD